MPSYGKVSKDKLATCHLDIQKVFNKVIQTFDNQILEGHRGEVEQNKAFAEGKSKLKWPNGNHNSNPSTAVDAGPYVVREGFKGVPWPDKTLRPKTYQADLGLFYFFAGYVIAVAKEMGIELRWGGDWDSDKDFSDNNFNDLVHFELLTK